jgi:hypothetical protein
LFGLNPVPKPDHKRRIEKRAKRTEFSKETRLAINERDNGLCIKCLKQAADIHHIEYRSSLAPDVSHKRNGCCLCLEHHELAHRSREFREWLRYWKDTFLDPDGDYIY